MRLLLVGGENSKSAHSKEEWARHKCGIIVLLDTKNGRLSRVVEYRGRYGPVDGSVTFKAASLVGRRLIVCTTTEILEYDIDSWEIVRSVSHKWLNDVHHVAETESGTLLIANTGLDMVMELSWEGECVNHWFVVPEAGWGKFDQEADYRLVASTKPHSAHPNFVTVDGENILVTRFNQKDAISLRDMRESVAIGIGFPHDGIISGDSIWYTSVNGFVSRYSKEGHKLIGRWDLNKFALDDRALGWCRGVQPLADGLVAVGFSRLRPTLFRENLHWLTNKLNVTNTAGVCKTRVLLLDTKSGKLASEIDVEPVGLNAIFSIHLIDG